MDRFYPEDVMEHKGISRKQLNAEQEACVRRLEYWKGLKTLVSGPGKGHRGVPNLNRYLTRKALSLAKRGKSSHQPRKLTRYLSDSPGSWEL